MYYSISVVMRQPRYPEYAEKDRDGDRLAAEPKPCGICKTWDRATSSFTICHRAALQGAWNPMLTLSLERHDVDSPFPHEFGVTTITPGICGICYRRLCRMVCQLSRPTQRELLPLAPLIGVPFGIMRIIAMYSF